MIPLLRYHQSEMKVSLELCSPREALALKSVSVVMTEVLAFLLAFSWANYQLLQDAFFFLADGRLSQSSKSEMAAQAPRMLRFSLASSIVTSLLTATKKGSLLLRTQVI